VDNGAPSKSDLVDVAPDFSLDNNAYGGTHTDEGPQRPILKCYDPKQFGIENLSPESSTQSGTSDIRD